MSHAWPKKPVAMVTGQEWACDPNWANHSPPRVFSASALELLKLVDFREKPPELSALPIVRDYMEDGERFQTELVWPLDPAMPDAVLAGLLSYEPINSLSVKAWLRWVSIICRKSLKYYAILQLPQVPIFSE